MVADGVEEFGEGGLVCGGEVSCAVVGDGVGDGDFGCVVVEGGSNVFVSEGDDGAEGGVACFDVAGVAVDDDVFALGEAFE